MIWYNFVYLEKSPSWSRAHDWKSCRRQKRLESSNPSFSAKKTLSTDRVFFTKTYEVCEYDHLSYHLFRTV